MPRAPARISIGNKRYRLGRSEPYAAIDFQTATIGGSYLTGTDQYKRDLTEKSITYQIFTEILPTISLATISGTQHYLPAETKSWRVQFTVNDQRQKGYIRTNGEFERLITFEMDRYFAFAFYMETTAGVNDFTTHSLNFTQLHQYNSQEGTGTELGPPINMRFWGGDIAPAGFAAGDVGMYWRYDGFQTPEINLTKGRTLAKGMWHHVIWHAKPSRIGKGIVEVWIDGRQVYNSGGGHNLAFSTDPDRTYPDGHAFNLADCGNYRTTPVETKAATDFYFAQVKLGPTYQSVLPG